MKKLIILLTTLLILQGCSSKGDISTEQLQNLTNSVSISQLEKTEFNKKDNKLVNTTNEEVITKEGFETLLKSLKLNSFNGKTVSVDGINSNEFNNKDFNIVIVTKNNNTATFSVKDSANKSFEISNKKYSKDFMKNKLTSFSKELISFDELAGTIQTDLDKGRSIVDKFKEVTEKVNASMLTLKSLSNDTIEYAKLDEVKQKVQRLESLTKNVVTAVNTSVESKKGAAIDAAFLNINDIDKIARDLAIM